MSTTRVQTCNDVARTYPVSGAHLLMLHAVRDPGHEAGGARGRPDIHAPHVDGEHLRVQPAAPPPRFVVAQIEIESNIRELIIF